MFLSVTWFCSAAVMFNLCMTLDWLLMTLGRAEFLYIHVSGSSTVYKAHRELAEK